MVGYFQEMKTMSNEELNAIDLKEQLDAATREASTLALYLWQSYYTEESPEFSLCDTPAGIITQIDNMLAGIEEKIRSLPTP